MRDNNWHGGHPNANNTPLGCEDQNQAPAAPMAGGPAPSAPMIMSFKEFVMKQEDAIDEVESVTRFKGYKVEFKKTQINDFFVLHKEEEWFKDKYHPVDEPKRTKEVNKSIRSRLKVYLDLMEQGHLDNVSLDVGQQEQMLKLLDKVVIKLEGGTDDEVKELDEGDNAASESESPTKSSTSASSAKKEESSGKKEEKEGKESPKKVKKEDGEDDDEDELRPPGDDEPAPPGM